MDHAISPRIEQLVTDLAAELNALTDKAVRRNVLQDLLQRLEFNTVVLIVPKSFPEHKIGVVYHAMSAVVGAITAGAASLVLKAQRAETPVYANVETDVMREDIEIMPGGGTFTVAGLGPFELHLPTWCDEQIALEIGSVLWRVLRFLIAGYDGESAEFVQTARALLRRHDRERYVRQYAALGFMQWLLTEAGIRTFDIYGNEVEDGPRTDYSKVFASREGMPPEYATRARRLAGEV